MASKVDICNLALQNLGASLITSLSEGSKNANECNLRYETARRALLNMHPWNFAIKRVALNQETLTPAFNYSYQFTLPSDCLFIIMTKYEEQSQTTSGLPIFNPVLQGNAQLYSDTIDKYRIEGRSLLSNSSNVSIIYIADVTDTQTFDGVFTELLARYLSALIAYRITGSKTERDAQYTIFKAELEEYMSIDSQQGVIDVISRSPLLQARL